MSDYARIRLTTSLQALGRDAEDIGRVLECGGWRGLPGSHRFCPVARYLRTVMADATDAEVDTRIARVRTGDGASVTVDLPWAVAGFVAAFDAEAFPDLIVTTVDDIER